MQRPSRPLPPVKEAYLRGVPIWHMEQNIFLIWHMENIFLYEKKERKRKCVVLMTIKDKLTHV